MTIDFSTKNPASCFIELSPELDDKNAWTGGLVLNILTSKDSPLDDDSRSHLINLCQLVASTVALMEEDPALAITLGKIASRFQDDPEIGHHQTNTMAGIKDQLFDINQEIGEYLKTGEKIPPHIHQKRKDLMNRLGDNL